MDYGVSLLDFQSSPQYSFLIMEMNLPIFLSSLSALSTPTIQAQLWVTLSLNCLGQCITSFPLLLRNKNYILINNKQNQFINQQTKQFYLFQWLLIFIRLMKKKQAEQYFNQLKKIDHQKNMKLADLINILTGGAISTKQYYQFIDYLKSNQFGQYNAIDEDIDKQDWRQFQFTRIYQLLKFIKDYTNKKGGGGVTNEMLSISNIPKQGSARNSHKDNSTVVDLLVSFNPIEDLIAKSLVQQKQYEQKWKAYKIKILKKLLIVFDFYRKSMHVKDQTFEKNQKITQHFDITMFMRYFKDFSLSASFQFPRVIKYFKKNAQNTIWLDFDRFVNTHMQLISFKEELPHEQKYLKLRGLNELLSPEKMKKILNVRRQQTTAVIVQGHTGAYKQDIIKHLQEKSKQRTQKYSKKWSGKSIKSQRNLPKQRIITQVHQKPLKSMISSKLLGRAKTEATSVYDELKLPKLRLKEHRNQSIYKSLNALNLQPQEARLKQLIDLQQNQQFLKQYLKQQSKQAQKAKVNTKKVIQLPRMRFT